MNDYLTVCWALRWHLLVLVVIPSLLMLWGEPALFALVSTVERMKR